MSMRTPVTRYRRRFDSRMMFLNRLVGGNNGWAHLSGDGKSPRPLLETLNFAGKPQRVKVFPRANFRLSGGSNRASAGQA